MTENRRRIEKWVHGRHLAVIVEVERIEVNDDPWSPYLDPEDIRRLEAARRAVDAGDVTEASRYGRVFELRELTV
jgi:hypothetical protein